LSKFGADTIMKNYLSDGTCVALSFKLNGKGFKLPANQEGVYAVLYKREGHQKNQMQNRRARAYNVSWRIIKDWLHAQLSLITSGQAQAEQVLLPFWFNGKQTLYEMFKNGTLQLGESSDANGKNVNSNIGGVD
jgi:hypothetical protein